MKCEATEVRKILEKVVKAYSEEAMEQTTIQVVMTKHPDWDKVIVSDFIKEELKRRKSQLQQK